jgi:hypothetical protein
LSIRTKMAVAAGLVLCVTSAASAGGSPVGPTGQVFDGVNPVLHPSIFDRSGKVYDWLGYSDARSRTRPPSAASKRQGDSR